MFESGAFKEKEDAITVLQELKKMMQAINSYSENETKNNLNKSTTSTFSLYNSDLVIGTNCIHITVQGAVYSYISFMSCFNMLS